VKKIAVMIVLSLCATALMAQVIVGPPPAANPLVAEGRQAYNTAKTNLTNMAAKMPPQNYDFKPVADIFDDVTRCPEIFLLWFHHLPWDHRLKSGRGLWDELVLHYHRGARQAAAFGDTWPRLSPYIDARRHQSVAARHDPTPLVGIG